MAEVDYHRHMIRQAEERTPGFTAFRLHRATAAHFSLRVNGYDMFKSKGWMSNNRLENYFKIGDVKKFYVSLEKRLMTPTELLGFYVFTLKRDPSSWVASWADSDEAHLKYRKWKAKLQSPKEMVRTELCACSAGPKWATMAGVDGKTPGFFSAWLAGKISDETSVVLDRFFGLRETWRTQTWVSMHPKWRTYDHLIGRLRPFLPVKDRSIYDGLFMEIGIPPATCDPS